MAARRPRSLLGRLFGNVWTGVVAPVLVAVLSALLAYHLGLGGGRGESPEAHPPPALKTGLRPNAGAEREPAGPEGRKATASPDLEEFTK